MSDKKRQYPRGHRDLVAAEGRAASRLDWRCYEAGTEYDTKELISYISYLKSAIVDYEYNEYVLYEEVEVLEKHVDDLLNREVSRLLTELRNTEDLLSHAFSRCEALQEELRVLREELADRETVIADLAKNLGGSDA